jgi:hypothetical protein
MLLLKLKENVRKPPLRNLPSPASSRYVPVLAEHTPQNAARKENGP